MSGTLDSCRSLLESLVRRPSITPDDAGCQALISERLTGAGFACERMDAGPVSNLWARRGSSGPLLCFAGHTDVVPPGDLPAWTSDPFEPTVRDGALYGRGAADMKSGLAAMIIAAETFVAETPEFAGSIAFLITSDEEGDATHGTRAVVRQLLARSEHIEWCVIGEPSSHSNLGDVIRVGRRGSLSGRVSIAGIQGHVAYPEQTDNPVRRFAPVLSALLAREWDSGNRHFPPTNLEVVSLAAGTGALNVTPPQLTASFNFRYSTEWNAEQLIAAVTREFDEHGVDADIDWLLQGEPFLTPHGKLLEAATSAIQEVTGALPELSTSGGTSDGRFIAPTGAEVVEIGPVNASIHKVDEHVLLDDLPGLVDIYRRILERLLHPA